MPSTATYSWANLFIDLKDELNEDNPSETALIRITNRILADLGDIDLPSAERLSTLYYCGPDFTRYAEPSDMKSRAFISLHPKERSQVEPLKFVRPTAFNGAEYSDMLTVQREVATEYFQLLSYDFQGLTTAFAPCETSLTAEGTWTAGTGVTNITHDTYRYKAGRGSINFDSTGETSATITFAKTSAVDIRSFTDQMRVRLFASLPTLPTSVTLRWGSDSSNYYSKAVTVQAHGVAFSTSDWNELEFDKASATITGTPDDSAIDYSAIVFAFSGATTDTDFGIDAITFIKPEAFHLEYYSKNLASTAAGVYSELVTVSAGTTDLVSLLQEERQAVIDGVCWRYLARRGGKEAAQIAENYRQLYEKDKLDIMRRFPTRRAQFSLDRRLPRLPA